MSYSYSTVTRYTTRTPKLDQPLIDKMAEMAAAGKTDGNIRTTFGAGASNANENIVVRNWSSSTDAQEWVDFINSHHPSMSDPFVSITIVPYIVDHTTLTNT